MNSVVFKTRALLTEWTPIDLGCERLRAEHRGFYLRVDADDGWWAASNNSVLLNGTECDNLRARNMGCDDILSEAKIICICAVDFWLDNGKKITPKEYKRIRNGYSS